MELFFFEDVSSTRLLQFFISDSFSPSVQTWLPFLIFHFYFSFFFCGTKKGGSVLSTAQLQMNPPTPPHTHTHLTPPSDLSVCSLINLNFFMGQLLLSNPLLTLPTYPQACSASLLCYFNKTTPPTTHTHSADPSSGHWVPAAGLVFYITSDILPDPSVAPVSASGPWRWLPAGLCIVLSPSPQEGCRHCCVSTALAAQFSVPNVV